MKFLIKLILASFVGTFAMFGALGSDNQWPGLIVAITVWVWFIYSLSKPEKRIRDRDRESERRIDELLRRLEQGKH
jgi:uncharacterized protein (DUF486 family)